MKIRVEDNFAIIKFARRERPRWLPLFCVLSWPSLGVGNDGRAVSGGPREPGLAGVP